MNRVDAYRHNLPAHGRCRFQVKLGCHVFRATGITACVEAGGILENTQALAAHESPRTTKLDLGGRHISESDAAPIAPPLRRLRDAPDYHT